MLDRNEGQNHCKVVLLRWDFGNLPNVKELITVSIAFGIKGSCES